MKLIGPLAMALAISLSACDRSVQEERFDPNWQERQEEIERQEEQEELGRTGQVHSELEDVEKREN